MSSIPFKLSITFLFILLTVPACSSDNIRCQPSAADSYESSQQCPTLHICEDGYCVHKDIFPLTARETIGTIILMILAGIANAGGLGGGALLTPILLLIFNYSANKSIVIVYSIVFGASLGNFINNAFQRDPKTGKSYVNYDLSLACMPLMTLGTMIGILLNRMAAPILIIIGLTIVILYTGKKIYKKAKAQFLAETNRAREPQQVASIPETKKDFEMVLLGNYDRQDEFESAENHKLQAILKEERQLFPAKKTAIIVLNLIFVVFTTFLRGSKDFNSPLGINYCGGEYWLMYLATLLGCGVIYSKGVALIHHNLEVKRENNYVEPGNEFTVTDDTINKITMLSILAGILAGLLGLGGGMVMSPLLLELGMGPQTLAATVGFFVVQTSFISLFQAFMYGDLMIAEIVFFMGVSFAGSYGVSTILNMMVKKYNRPSIILIMLSFVLLLSLIVMPTFGVYKSIEDPEQMFKFRSLC